MRGLPHAPATPSPAPWSAPHDCGKGWAIGGLKGISGRELPVQVRQGGAVMLGWISTAAGLGEEGNRRRSPPHHATQQAARWPSKMRRASGQAAGDGRVP